MKEAKESNIEVKESDTRDKRKSNIETDRT